MAVDYDEKYNLHKRRKMIAWKTQIMNTQNNQSPSNGWDMTV